ncbi:putative mitochondrial processing peptidase, beta subunit [Trypanosoma cruzi]|uniref:Putative mitochondrial processing peptidase, beta subunit n=1 Tax=Trypanosoma cruzi TaxID=5693 RepID=A0A2V2WNZ5_TRYCR|nr:putative mitochondrial processing peptidase, beta subunit [Trypanosoma cruzi]
MRGKPACVCCHCRGVARCGHAPRAGALCRDGACAAEVRGCSGQRTRRGRRLQRRLTKSAGQLTVQVGREQTHLYMRVTKQNTERAVGLLADVVRNARLADEDIQAAKQAVLKEHTSLKSGQMTSAWTICTVAPLIAPRTASEPHSTAQRRASHG